MSVAARLGADRYIVPAELPATTTTTARELVTHDGAAVAGLLRTVPGAHTVAVLMHPRQDFSHHVLVTELLSRGYAVWTQGTRSVGNDLSLLHEQALLDMAAGHVFLRDQGYEHVVAVGHSGGAAFATYYIEQASLAPADRFTSTPGGKPVPLDEAQMPTPDALVLMAPHPGQGVLLQRLIDPSVANESDPLSVDPSLDPYNPHNGFVEAPNSSSYASDFVEVYRTAQKARVARIDAIAHNRVDDARGARRRQHEGSRDARDHRASLATGVLVVHRTDADLRSVDLSMDVNDRPYGSLFGRRPDLTNYGVIGFGRITTPEAWLSTWSANYSRAGMLRCAPGVDAPVLLVELTGDQACFPSDARAMLNAFPGADRKHVRVEGRHFGAALHPGGPTGAGLAGEQIANWLYERYPAA